jgi:hypothetical protein
MMGRPVWPVRNIAAVPMVLLVAAACQSSGPVTTPAGGTASVLPASGSPQTTPPPTTATGEASPADLEVGPGTFYLPDPMAGLDALASYTETLTVSFEGTADGQARTWSKTYRLQHTAQPAASVLTIEVSGDMEPPHPDLVAEAAGTTYEHDAGGTCTGRPLDPDNSALAAHDPAALLPGLVGAEEAGAEEVNGVASGHFTFDERAMLAAGVADSGGEVWVGNTGGYVVRFLLRTTADAAYFGAGLAGTMTWDYQLTDVNQLTGVAFPAGCQTDAPIMSGATNVLVLSRYAGFDTTSSVSDVVAFYKKELPKLGWAFKSAPFEGDDRAVVEFTSGEEIMNVLVTTTDTGTRVDIAVTGG